MSVNLPPYEDWERPWEDFTYVAFDTETSGKYPLSAEICEIAAVKWQGGKIVGTFQSFCKTRRPMGQQVINIHKITNEMIADAPAIDLVLPQFDEFIKGSVLIAHHAPFDLGFLAVEYEKRALPLPGMPSLCSCILAQRAFPKSVNHRLATLVEFLGIYHGQAHRALDDSKACLEVGLRCMQAVGEGVSLRAVFEFMGQALTWERFGMAEISRQPPFSTVIAAARDQLVLEITYTGGTQPGVPRRVTPMGIVRNPEGDYLVGLCHRENAEKRFYFNRILTSKILD